MHPKFWILSRWGSNSNQSKSRTFPPFLRWVTHTTVEVGLVLNSVNNYWPFCVIRYVLIHCNPRITVFVQEFGISAIVIIRNPQRKSTTVHRHHILQKIRIEASIVINQSFQKINVRSASGAKGCACWKTNVISRTESWVFHNAFLRFR